MKKLLIILSILYIGFAVSAQTYEQRYLLAKDRNGNLVKTKRAKVYKRQEWVTIPAPEDTAQTVNELMGRGLCARYITPNDGTMDFSWNSQQLDDFEAEDIDNVRAVCWYFNDNGSAPWTITPSVLTNLGAMIDSVNAHGMIFILDHHQPMIKRNFLYTTANVERFLSHWAQIAEYCDTRFDSTELVYELMNEPEYSASDPNSQMTASQWNDIQQAAIDSIRLYDTDKSIMITPHGWSKIEYLDDMDTPTDPSDRLILSIHYYDPDWMTKQGVSWVTWDSGTRNATEWLYNGWPNIWPFWNNLAEDFDVLEDWLDDNPGIDVTIGEWGTVNGDIHTPDRVAYAGQLKKYFEESDYSWSWWDDAGSFGVYDNSTYAWDDSMLNALFYDDLGALEAYDSTVLYQSDFSADTDGWSTFTSNGGAVSLSSNGSQLVCNVTNAGSSGSALDVRVKTPSLAATKDSIYRVSYTISGTKGFCADILNEEFSWHNITNLASGGSYSRVYTYEMAYTTIASNEVQFLLGGSTGLFYIDDLLIERISLGTPTPTDTVEYTLLWAENFDDFAVQSTLSGDTLEAHVDNFESASSTGGDGVYEDAGIVLFDGSNVMESRYPEGECCVEGNTIADWPTAGSNYTTTGTGVDWRAYVTSAEESDPDPPRRLVISMNIYLDPDFENSNGFKLPALCTEKGSGWDNGTMRMMIVDYSVGTEFDPQYYSHGYWNGFAQPVVTQANTKTNTPDSYFPRGEWINVAMVLDAGTLTSSNGWVEFFINGEMIVDDLTSVPFIGTGDVEGLTYIEFTTFMGGSSAGYMSPRDQYMYIDDAIVYYLDDDADYTHPSSEGDELYLPPEANWPR